MSDTGTAPSQRIDKWLWCARFFKTRTLASKFVAGGKIRLTRAGATQRVEKASALIQPQDRLTFLIGTRMIDATVLSCAERRGPATEARLLYEDHTPPPAPNQAKQDGAMPPETNAHREKGTGRPTKKDRRALDALKR